MTPSPRIVQGPDARYSSTANIWSRDPDQHRRAMRLKGQSRRSERRAKLAIRAALYRQPILMGQALDA